MTLDGMRPLHVLLVEDNPDHAELTQRALADGRLTNAVVWVKDGAEALDYLFRRKQYVGAARPGLILLDLKLPKVDGVKVLRQIKDDPELASIPVVMLTTSAHDEEIRACYDAGANSFVTKPMQFGEFVQKVAAIRLYWTLTNRLPDA